MACMNTADILERSIYGATLLRLWAEIPFRGQFMRDQVRLMTEMLELHCVLGHGYPWAQQILSLTSGVILSWNFLSFVSHWIN